jgi:hypothetical protein
MIAWWTGGAWVLYFSDAPVISQAIAGGAGGAILTALIGAINNKAAA